MDLRELKAEYLRQLPLYETLADRVADQLRTLLRDGKIPHDVDCRAKKAESLIRKVISKRYSSLDRVSDKAGARVVVARLADIDRAVELISSHFRVKEIDNKSARLEHNQLGYRGLHIQIECTGNFGAGEMMLECEIQVRTRAENLWNDVSHELLYKPTGDVPGEVSRRINRLVALVELFDEQVETARGELGTLSGTESWAMTAELESIFLELTGKPYDRDLTFHVVETLLPAFLDAGMNSLRAEIGAFVEQSSDRLLHIYNEYGEADLANPFLNQPESILTWYLLERDAYKLRDQWGEAFALDYLEDLARYWGQPYSTV